MVCRGGTSSRHSMSPPAKFHGIKACNSCAVHSPHTATTWPVSSIDHLPKNGSTPSRARAKLAVHFVCRSSMTDRWYFSIGRAASTRRKQPRTNLVTPITTHNWQTARRCKNVCRWRLPRQRASFVKLSSLKRVYRDSQATNDLLCSTPISVAPIRLS